MDKILEALKMQPLSEEEKAARHILGRLYGPIATCKENTRNGRRYNKDLWEKALADDIFKEKLATKSLFLELGHPSDREETDMRMVCACIPEMPRIVDGDLYAYVDILDTDNGRLLKTLCDYGFVPGISSRGSGDIMDNDEVDPETFFLETWDIVQLPAVKKARLKVCESLNSEELKLRKALVESYNDSNEEGKKIMSETLKNLDINILSEDIDNRDGELEAPVEAVETDAAEQEVTPAETYPAGTPVEPAPLPASQLEECNDSLKEEAEEVIDDSNKIELHEEETEEVESEETSEEASAEETTEEESEEAEEQSSEEAQEETSENTVSVLIDTLSNYDKDLELELGNIVIDDKEYVPEMSFDDSEEGKLIIGINCTPVEGSENKEADAEETAEVEAEEESEEAVDNGDDEVIESLKEAIRQKTALEREVKELKNKQTVGDAEVKELQEQLNKYKTAFARASELAGKSTKLEKENASLKEELGKKDTTIQTLKETADSAKRLTESMQNDSHKVKTLTEKIASMQAESEATEKALNEQVTQYKQKLAERTALAKQYKAKVDAMLEKYIASKASMLGVRTSDIKSRLNEGYNMDDIDKVCDDLLDYNIGMSKLPFDINRSGSIRVTESAERKTPANPEDGYELDDSLFELAGLDKKNY